MFLFARSIVGRSLVIAGFAGLTGHFASPVTAISRCFQDTPIEVSDSPKRTWTSADGKFSVEGKLVSIEADFVRLESADGKLIQVATEKLSAADVTFVKKETARAAAKAENPFMEVGGGAAKNPFAAVTAAKSANLDVVPVMLSLRTVDLDSSTSADPAAVHWQEPPRKPVRKFRVNSHSMHAQVTGTCSGPDERLFAISFHEPFGVNLGGPRGSGSGDKVKAWVELLELPDAKSLGRFPLADDRSVVADVDPAGKYLLTFDGVFAREPKIRLFEIGGDGMVLLSSWFSKNSKGRDDKATSAKILADGKIVTCFSGELVVWRADPVESVFLFPNDSNDSWKLAADRRHAWVEKGGKRYEVDLVDGKCTGVVGDPTAAGSATEAVSADGQRFATLTGSVMTIRSAAGEVLDEFYAPVFWPNAKLAWLDENTIRIESPNQHHFVDVPRRAVFLEVAAMGNRTPASGWSVEKERGGRDNFVTVGQVAAAEQQNPDLEQYRRQLPVEAESMLVFHDGNSIALSFQLDAAPNLEADIRTLLTGVLESRGAKIVEGAKDQLRAVSTARDETIEYQRFGAPPWDPNSVEKVNVKIVENRLELVRDGKVVWSRSSSSGPGFMLHMKEGETAQQAVDRQTGDPARFWKSFQLPKHVAAHPNGSAWSRLMKTGNGYQELK